MRALKPQITLPLTVKNVKAAGFGINSTRGEVATADLVDSAGKFVMSGGFEEVLERAAERGWTVDNETEARWLASRFGGV